MPHEVGSYEEQALCEQLQHPHAATIQGLRDTAAWLALHPELPAVYHASVSFGWNISTEARHKLTLVAEALCDRAEENRNTGYGEVTIRGEFGPVTVSANAKNRDLLDAPLPEPIPAPIIPAKEVVDDA